MLLTPFDAGQKALPEVREIMPIVRVEILLVDKKIHKRAVLARQVAIQVRLDLLRPMRIEDDIQPSDYGNQARDRKQKREKET